jgi:hypothetical protein
VIVAGTSGVFPRGEAKLFSAHHVGRGGYKQSRSQVTANVIRGLDISQPMKSLRWTMTGNLFSLVSEVAAIMTVLTWHMSLVMGKGK